MGKFIYVYVKSEYKSPKNQDKTISVQASTSSKGENDLESQKSNVQKYTIQLSSEKNTIPCIEIRVGMSISEIEKRVYQANLIYYKGNRALTAQILNVCEKTVYNKIVTYQLYDL